MHFISMFSLGLKALTPDSHHFTSHFKNQSVNPQPSYELTASKNNEHNRYTKLTLERLAMLEVASPDIDFGKFARLAFVFTTEQNSGSNIISWILPIYQPMEY